MDCTTSGSGVADENVMSKQHVASSWQRRRETYLLHFVDQGESLPTWSYLLLPLVNVRAGRRLFCGLRLAPRETTCSAHSTQYELVQVRVARWSRLTGAPSRFASRLALFSRCRV